MSSGTCNTEHTGRDALCSQACSESHSSTEPLGEGWPWHLALLLPPHSTPWAGSPQLTKTGVPRIPPQLTAVLSRVYLTSSSATYAGSPERQGLGGKHSMVGTWGCSWAPSHTLPGARWNTRIERPKHTQKISRPKQNKRLHPSAILM